MNTSNPVHLCTLPTVAPLPALAESARIQYTPDGDSPVAAFSIDGLNLFALPSGERISRQHKDWSVESTRLLDVWQYIADDTRVLVDGHTLAFDSGGVLYRLTDPRAEEPQMTQAIKLPAAIVNPAPIPDACDPMPMLLSVLRRSAVVFGRAQVYVEPDGVLTVWTSTITAVSVCVSEVDTRLRLHIYDPVSLQQHPATSERVYAPLSGAAVLRLFASAVFG